MPLVSRTRATLRSAELGFFGVCVKTRTHTPRFCGLFCSAGLFVLLTILFRPLRTSWLIVGTGKKLPVAQKQCPQPDLLEDSKKRVGPRSTRVRRRLRRAQAGLAPDANTLMMKSRCAAVLPPAVPKKMR